MNMPRPTASFRPMPVQDRWQVEVAWSDGRVQFLSGYLTEDEAKSWIAFCSDQWIKAALIDYSLRKRDKAPSGKKRSGLKCRKITVGRRKSLANKRVFQAGALIA